jgi:hypothetical protein
MSCAQREISSGVILQRVNQRLGKDMTRDASSISHMGSKP